MDLKTALKEHKQILIDCTEGGKLTHEGHNRIEILVMSYTAQFADEPPDVYDEKERELYAGMKKA